MNSSSKLLVALPISLLALAAEAATTIMPDFSTVPTDWATDRYDPASFSEVGPFAGRDPVLGIGISSADSLANRPPGFQDIFYNTQGKGYQFASVQGAGSVLAADLYVPASWSDGAANGHVRTDMWGVMDAPSQSPDPHVYPIIGFSNYGGAARFRVWDGDSGWVDLATPVAYNAWTSLAIEYTGTSFVFSINGANVYTDSVIQGATGFSAALMQAYNFGDPANLPGANPVDYTAHWSNAQVPEPTTMVAGALLMLPFGIGMLRQLRKNRTA